MSLACPVRGCGEALRRGEGRFLACPRGHRFDLARSGYCNLLQPQDKRSRHPGDPAAAVAARRRLFDAGHGDWLLPHLRAALDRLPLPPAQPTDATAPSGDTGLGGMPAVPGLGGAPAVPNLGGMPAVLDIGCGEGFYLGTLVRERGFVAHGLDLAAAAVDLAARRYPAATWVVANADRFLPYTAGSIDLAMSLTARINPPEIRRILRGAPAGHLLIAVPGPDDLVELRAAVLGEGELRDRLQQALAALAADFDLVWQGSARTVLHLDADALRDLLAATYRGARGSQREQAAALTAREVTMSRDLACLRPRRETR